MLLIFWMGCIFLCCFSSFILIWLLLLFIYVGNLFGVVFCLVFWGLGVLLDVFVLNMNSLVLVMFFIVLFLLSCISFFLLILVVVLYMFVFWKRLFWKVLLFFRIRCFSFFFLEFFLKVVVVLYLGFLFCIWWGGVFDSLLLEVFELIV